MSGQCDLTDGSTTGQWRLPNIRELQSLVDYGQVDPALPAGHPFTGVLDLEHYWSSTSYIGYRDPAWDVDLRNGLVYFPNKTSADAVWPVRGGQ